MNIGSYIALSRQTTIQDQMNMVSNNMANINTPGFKADQMIFHEFIITPENGKPLSFVQNHGHATNFEQSDMEMTHAPLDCAIQGEGFFAVQTPSGVRYTRDGHFIISENGSLITSEGFSVLSQSGTPISIPANATKIKFTKDGSIFVSQDNDPESSATIIGVLSVVKFANNSKLIKQGDNLYNAVNQQPIMSLDKIVVQGALEKSNVKSIIELNKMISMTHTNQLVISFIALEHKLQEEAIQKINKD